MVDVALRPGGIFTLDYLNAAYIMPRLVPGETKIIDNVVYTITRRCDGKHFYKRIIIEDRDTNKTLEFTEKVAVLLPEDFESLFASTRLRIHGLYGDYRLTPYHRDHSPRLIVMAGRSRGQEKNN